MLAPERVGSPAGVEDKEDLIETSGQRQRDTPGRRQRGVCLDSLRVHPYTFLDNKNNVSSLHLK